MTSPTDCDVYFWSLKILVVTLLCIQEDFTGKILVSKILPDSTICNILSREYFAIYVATYHTVCKHSSIAVLVKLWV